MDTVNFIIPTLGRYSLHKALQSLRDQTNPDWYAYVIFDNHHVSISQEEKIQSFTFNKPPGHGAGTVRNHAIDMVKDGWIAFLDDDDWVDKKYVDRINYWGNQGFDLISFSYRDVSNGNIQPPRHLNEIVRCNIGISFAVRTKIVQENNIRFIQESVEDFDFIDKCVKSGARPIITHEILYFVSKRGEWII